MSCQGGTTVVQRCTQRCYRHMAAVGDWLLYGRQIVRMCSTWLIGRSRKNRLAAYASITVRPLVQREDGFNQFLDVSLFLAGRILGAWVPNLTHRCRPWIPWRPVWLSLRLRPCISSKLPSMPDQRPACQWSGMRRSVIFCQNGHLGGVIPPANISPATAMLNTIEFMLPPINSTQKTKERTNFIKLHFRG